jgi:small-conductance mechanosensitive channel
MVARGPSTVRLIGWLVLGACLMRLPGLSSAWAGPGSAGDAQVSIADLEQLVRQIEEPSQREQLLKTLQALILAAKQRQPAAPSPVAPPARGAQSHDLFLAFGRLTEETSTVGRALGHGLAALPALLSALPVYLMQPDTFRLLVHLGLVIGALVVLALLLHLLAARLMAKLRAHLSPATPRPLGRKIWSALLIVGARIGLSLVLLAASGIVLSVFPVGAVLAGLVGLALVAVIAYQVARTIGLVLLNPDAPAARLLPIGDATARKAWAWSLHVLKLSVAYYVITRSLLLSGVAEAVYQLVRGLMVVAVAAVLSLLVWRLARVRRPPAGEAAEAERVGFRANALAAFHRAWPVVAIAYIWCAAFFALARFQPGVTHMVAASLQMALVIAVCLLLLWASDRLYARALAMRERVGQYLPGLEARTLRYVKAIWWGVRLLIMLAGVLLVLQVWGIGMSWLFTSPIGSELLTRLVILGVAGASVALAVDLSSFISQRLIAPGPDGGEPSKKRKTLIPLVAKTVKYAAVGIGALVALHQVGVNITPILAGVGILSLAVGFGAQTLVKDIINGLFILFEDSIAVGDVVVIKGIGGLVEAVNLRTLRLRDLDGSVHIIPNSQVDVIRNMTKDFSYYVLDVGVAYREDTDEVIAVLREIDAGMRQDPAYASDMLEPIEIMGVDRFADSAVVVKARLKTKPIRQWNVGREFNRRLKKAFDARGIELPFPHRTLYWGAPKRGEAPPMHLHIHTLDGATAATDQGQRQGVASKSAASEAS